MIKTNQLFEKLSPALAEEFFSFFNAQQKQALNVAIQGMAVKRKMRPIFVQRMVPQKRYQWLHRELARRDNLSIAENLVQTWFMETQSAMLCDFMDSLGIEHNEKGEVETMPSDMPEAKLKKGVADLLGKYDAEKVVFYLHTIPALEMAEWPDLLKLLAEDQKLRFPGQDALIKVEDISAATASAPAAEAEKPAKEAKTAPAKKAATKKATPEVEVEAAAETAEAEVEAKPAKKPAAKKATAPAVTEEVAAEPAKKTAAKKAAAKADAEVEPAEKPAKATKPKAVKKSA